MSKKYKERQTEKTTCTNERIRVLSPKSRILKQIDDFVPVFVSVSGSVAEHSNCIDVGNQMITRLWQLSGCHRDMIGGLLLLVGLYLGSYVGTRRSLSTTKLLCYELQRLSLQPNCSLRYYRGNLLFDYWESAPNVFSISTVTLKSVSSPSQSS